MNGSAKNWFALAVAGGAVAAIYYFTRSSGDTAAGGDESGGDASGDYSSSEPSALEGVTSTLGDWASTIGYTLGISTPKGLRNHNPGNLRYVASIQWNGQVGDDGTGYAVFDSDEHGVRALAHQLQTYAGRGITSVAQIISTYAPSNENDTAAYIRDVSGTVGVDPNQPLDVYGLLVQLVGAIIHHENGVQPFSDDQLNTWCYEA
jgi:hypothetical protein